MPCIEVTEAALWAFRDKLDKRPARAIRFGVRGAGCSGFKYVIEFDDGLPRAGDDEWQAGGITFVVDKKSALYLSGSVVTWSKSLLREGFEFTNPHEASRCGCGHSFQSR